MGVKKRILALCLALALLAQAALAASFSTDPEAINRAALSVMKLEIYGSDRELKSTGSGFVAFADDVLVTNYHVVRGAAYVAAYSDGGERYMAAYVLAADEAKDIAILAFSSPTGIEPLTLDETGGALRAAPVIAIGSPKGYKNSVSNGIVSSVFEENGISYIQFTAPVSSGSSGGALFNDRGEVIGITTWVYNDGYGINQNLNFAVDIREVVALYRAHEQDAPVPVADWAGGGAERTPAPTASPAPAAPAATPGAAGAQAPVWRDMVTAVVGEPFGFTLPELRASMELFGLPEGGRFKWEDEPLTTFGYNMYALSNPDGDVVLTVHEMDGPGSVSAFEIDAFVPTGGSDGDDGVAEDFGTLLACMWGCAYVMEHADVSYEGLTDGFTAAQDVMAALGSAGDITPADLNSGVSALFSLTGYPCALSLKTVVNEGEEYLWLCLEMLPADGRFE